MKKALCLSSALIICAAALSSCSVKSSVTKFFNSDGKDSEKSASSYTGKWECSEIEMDGEKSKDLWGMDVSTLFQIELSEDNKGTFFSFLTTLVQPEPFDLTWKDNGNGEIVLNIDQAESDEPVTMTYKNGQMIMDQSDEYSSFKAYLDKVDTFTALSEDESMSFNFSGDLNASFGSEDGADVSFSFSDDEDDLFDFSDESDTETETEPTTKKYHFFY